MRARSIYQARPLIMALTDDKELKYNYFSQTLLPDYIEEHGVDWDVVYDARGHFEEPHTNRDMGCSTIEVRDYLDAMKDPEIVDARFRRARASTSSGPNGGYAGVLFCEKEGFGPLFKSVDLANRYDLMFISSKGVSVTAMRRLIDEVCGENDLPLFVLHDFDVAGFMILGTLSRDTRRYTFDNEIEVVVEPEVPGQRDRGVGRERGQRDQPWHPVGLEGCAAARCGGASLRSPSVPTATAVSVAPPVADVPREHRQRLPPRHGGPGSGGLRGRDHAVLGRVRPPGATHAALPRVTCPARTS